MLRKYRFIRFMVVILAFVLLGLFSHSQESWAVTQLILQRGNAEFSYDILLNTTTFTLNDWLEEPNLWAITIRHMEDTDIEHAYLRVMFSSRRFGGILDGDLVLGRLEAN